MTKSETCFWKYVKKGKPDECWEWSGFRRPTGYGSNPTMEEPRAHRMSWVIHNGPIPDGLHVLHKCDNPPCSNPNHLFLGTPKDNAHDRDKKGRQVSVKGEAYWSTKLTTQQVLDIRWLKKKGLSAKAIWDTGEFPISYTQTKRIVRSDNWKHIHA